MDIKIFLAAIFLIALASVFFYKKINAKKKFCIGIDINKAEKNGIPESAGIAMLATFWIAIIYIRGVGQTLLPYAGIATVFAIVGLFDDFRHKFISTPMPWLTRALPIATASFAYALYYSPNLIWVIPVSFFIAGTASLQNTFAGLNGWEVGSGFIISIFVAFILFGTQFFLMAAALPAIILALLLFNAYPAKVFPGDSGTLFIGSAISALVVLSKDTNLMLLTFLFFIPHMLDFFILKMITNRSDPTQQKIRPYKLLSNDHLAIPDYPNGKIRYDFAKLLIKIFGEMKEQKIVLIIWTVVAVNGLVWLKVFGKI